MENQIILVDCYEELKKIPNNSVDLILTDPPYQISRKSNFTKNSTNKKFNQISLDFGVWDHEEVNLFELFKEFKRVLKDGGTIIIFYDIWKSQNFKLIAEDLKLKQPRVGQWVKTNPVPINSKTNYLSNSIEFFFCFVKKNKKTFNSEYNKGIYHFPICHGRERTSHPTQKPINLIKELILTHSNEGEIVLDCFAGSGTTGVACQSVNRKYILMENSKEYYDIIVDRISVIEGLVKFKN